MIQTKTVRVDSVRKALSAHHMQKNFRLEIRFPESYNAKNAAQGEPKELRDPQGNRLELRRNSKRNLQVSTTLQRSGMDASLRFRDWHTPDHTKCPPPRNSLSIPNLGASRLRHVRVTPSPRPARASWTAGRRHDAVHAQVVDHLPIVVKGMNQSLDGERQSSCHASR